MIRVEAGDADSSVRAAGRGAGAQLPALAAAATGRQAAEGAVAGAVGGPDRAGRGRLRGPVPGLGSSQDRDADAGRRPPRPGLDGPAGAEAHRQGAGGRLPGRTPPARRGAAGGVRGAALGAEPGLAARLHRVRDPPRRHLADRRRRRLLVEARARLARLDHREPP